MQTVRICPTRIFRLISFHRIPPSGQILGHSTQHSNPRQSFIPPNSSLIQRITAFPNCRNFHTSTLAFSSKNTKQSHENAPQNSIPSDAEALAASLRFAGTEPPRASEYESISNNTRSANQDPTTSSNGEEASSQKQSPRRWVFNAILLTLTGFFTYRTFGPDDDTAEIEESLKEMYLPVRCWQRASHRWTAWRKYFADPVAEKLLPEPLPHPYQRPFTLVINLDDTLVHSHWDPQHGWRHLKRPGVEYFLAYLCQYYEIVVFTKSQSFTAMPIIEQLDPFGYILYKLFRESTRYEDGKHIKDLSNLNRDLKKVIIMDVSDDAVSRQPENAIVMPKWEGDMKDDKLLSYLPFLETLAMTQPSDVRTVLKSYGSTDIPTHFEQMQRQQFAKLKSGGGRTSLSTFTGGGQRTMEPIEVLQKKHLMFINDQIDYRKALLEHKKKVEQQQEKEMQEAASKKMNFMEYIMTVMQGGQTPPPPPSPPNATKESSPS